MGKNLYRSQVRVCSDVYPQNTGKQGGGENTSRKEGRQNDHMLHDRLYTVLIVHARRKKFCMVLWMPVHITTQLAPPARVWHQWHWVLWQFILLTAHATDIVSLLVFSPICFLRNKVEFSMCFHPRLVPLFLQVHPYTQLVLTPTFYS